MSNAQVFLLYFLHLTACLCFSQAQRPSPSTIGNNEDVYKVFRFYTNTTDDLHFVMMLQDAAAKLNVTTDQSETSVPLTQQRSYHFRFVLTSEVLIKPLI
ncbi:conserved hypothetical protein [Trichinella spiralis]|uniref:hypothetical protein n=1 Tax=Trichinella spiralis TaxID=6334 RepID=UPI0001EFCE75|nr:conserved hypothetical protein [Trichinella spiralis]